WRSLQGWARTYYERERRCYARMLRSDRHVLPGPLRATPRGGSIARRPWSAGRGMRGRVPAASPDASALHLHDLFQSYALGESTVEVLRGVGLAIPRAEMCAVMGPSGVGKSTLLNCIAGLDVPDRGRIEVLGRDVAGLEEEERTLLRRRHVGIVYQFFNLVPTLSARENVTLPYLIDGVRPDEGAVERALGRVGMTRR